MLRRPAATLDHLAEAREAGYSALVLTVDTPYLGRRERDLRLGFERSARPAAPVPRGSDRDVAMTLAEQVRMTRRSPGATSNGLPRSRGCRSC